MHRMRKISTRIHRAEMLKYVVNFNYISKRRRFFISNPRLEKAFSRKQKKSIVNEIDVRFDTGKFSPKKEGKLHTFL